MGGIQVKISLPSNYDPNQTYPAILLNDGNLDFLSSLSESVILVGLTSKKSPRWLHSLEGSYSERWSSRFWRSGQRLSWSFIWRPFRQVAVALSTGRSSPCLWRILTRWFGSSLQSFSFDKVSCVFSICGSFWYPDFVAYCKEENVKNLDCLLYLQNGQTEGAHHTNRLAQAPVYAEQIHTSLQKCYPNGQFVFDTYGHHEQVAERFLAFSSWLAQKWKIE